MSDPVVQQNLTPVREPSLKDLLDLYKKQTMLGLNCHHLATIQSFNASAQTITATINYKKTFFQYDPQSKAYTSTLQDYPLVADCPVVVIGGGPARITFPIAKGDQCLLLFNDRDMNNWYAGSTTSATQTPRLHSFADCVALIGPNNQNTVLAAYDAVRALLTNGNVMLGINPSNNKVTFANSASGSFNTLLQNLCTQLQNLTNALALLTVSGVTPGGGVSGVPVNAATITSVGTQIASIAMQIGGLIE